MSATRSTHPAPVVPRRAAGYAREGGAFVNRPALLPGIAFSAGALLSTVTDLARWDAALRGDTILTAESRALLWTATRSRDDETLPFDYGLGWFLDTYRGHRLVQHSGATPGFSSVFYRFPDDGLSVVVLTNIAGTNIDHWAIDIAAQYLPALDRRTVVPDPQPELTARHRAMLQALADRRVEGHAVNAPMRRFLQTTTGASLFAWYLEGQPIEAFALTSIEARAGGRMRRYLAQVGPRAIEVSFLVTDDDQVAQILWW